MAIKLNFKSNIKKIVKNYLLFCDDDFKIEGLKKLKLSKNIKDIENLVKNNTIKEKKLHFFNINQNQTITLVNISKNFSSVDVEKRGAAFFKFISDNSIKSSSILEENIKSFTQNHKTFLSEFIHGIKLQSYTFQKYKSQKKI